MKGNKESKEADTEGVLPSDFCDTLYIWDINQTGLFVSAVLGVAMGETVHTVIVVNLIRRYAGRGLDLKSGTDGTQCQEEG